MINTLEQLLLVLLLVVLMLGMGATLTPGDFARERRQPRALLVGVASQFGWMPAIAAGLAWALHLPAPAAIALVLVGCTPGGTTSNLFAWLMRANLALSITMTVASTVVAVVAMPLALALYTRPWRADEAAIAIPYGSLVVTLVLVLVPLGLGMLLRRRNQTWAARAERLGSWAGIAVLVLLIGSSVLRNQQRFAQVDASAYLAAIALGLAGMALGYLGAWLAKLDVPSRRAVSLETGIQNSPLALGMISLSFPESVRQEMLVVPLLYALFVLLNAAAVTALVRAIDTRRSARAAAVLLAVGLVAGCDDSAAGNDGNGPARDAGGDTRPSLDAGLDPDEDTTPGEDAADDGLLDAGDTTPTPDTGCIEGTRFCLQNSVAVCGADGSVQVETACPTGCRQGACTNLCADEKGYYGCSFLAVDLDNTEISTFGNSAASQPWAVVVSNPTDATVLVTIRDGMGSVVAGPEAVAAGATRAFEMPRADADATMRGRIAFRIESDGPVTAHQFNPQNNVGVYSNDASLLFPVNVLGREYLVLGWPTEVQQIPLLGARALHSFVTVAAPSAGVTRVTIIAPAGSGVAAGPGVPSITAGGSATFDLQEAEVLSMTTPQTHRADLSGMRILGDRPLAVWAGHECANIPFGNTYCDHLEHQQLPLEAWGTSYAAAKFRPRGTEDDIWRIISQRDGTVVTTDPPQGSAGTVTLNNGESIEFRSTQDFLITASHPVQVAQYMVGSSYPGPENGCTREDGDMRCAIRRDPRCGSADQPSAIGDPAMLILVPDSRLRDDYLVLTPQAYHEDWLTMITPAGVRPILDGAPVGGTPAPLGTTGREVWRVAVQPGAHRVTADEPFVLYAYGYDCDVSYAYAGGIELGTL